MGNRQEFLDIYHDIMVDNGMYERIYGEFKPSTEKCGWNGCEKQVKDERDYLRHLKYYHGIK